MMYKYLSILSLPLAISVNFLNITAASSLAVFNDKSFAKQPTETSSLVATPIVARASTSDRAQKPSYLSLMNAGYNANEKQDYLTALNYFQQALSLQPKDSKAQSAIKTITSYGFDLYMRSGYAADRIRDYNTALQNFQKALQIRPDSLYAKQAVDNVTHYLAQQPIEENDNGNNGLNLWFMFVAIGIASALSAVLLFYLFKKTGHSLQSELDNSEEATLNTSGSSIPEEVIERLEPLEQASSPISDRFKPDTTNTEESSPPMSSSPESARQQPPATSPTSAEKTAAIVSANNSLVKLDIIPELIQNLAQGDRSLRSKTIWELAQRGDSRAMKPLVELMVDVDSQERGLILEAMTQIAGRTLKPMNQAIMMSLDDENTNVKQNAIRDLTRVYELMSQVTKRLSLVIEDSDAQVQETAKWALQKLERMPKYSATEADNLTSEINNLNANHGTNGIDKNREPDYPLN